MAIRLRLIADQIVAPSPDKISRYARDIAYALVGSAPAGCEVEAVLSSTPGAAHDHIRSEIPGLAEITMTSLGRRELATAWRYGLVGLQGDGMIHSPSLLAPLRKHDTENGNQVVVTVHDIDALIEPGKTTSTSGFDRANENSKDAAWQKQMLARAYKFADAVVVPTHALAEDLASHYKFGDRLRVIGTAPRAGLLLGAGSAKRAEKLKLPDDYVLTTGGQYSGLVDIFDALAHPNAPEVHLVVLDPKLDEAKLIALAEDHKFPKERLRQFRNIPAADLAVVVDRAIVYVAACTTSGSAVELIEAFSQGTPVIHSNTPAHEEIAGGDGLSVSLGEHFIDGLANSIRSVVEDDTLREKLQISSADRAIAFSWQDTAERIWQLHAEI